MNRKSMIKLCALALAMCSFSAFADTVDEIAASKTLRVAVLQDFPPFGSIGTDMQPRGYDIDVAMLLAKKLGVRAVIIPVSGANRIPYLQTRKVDIIIGCLGRNAAREKVIDYGPKYAVSYNAIFGSKDLKVTQAGDLVGKSIGVSRGSTEDLDLTKLAPPGANVRRFEDSNGNISAFLSGQVDMMTTDMTVVAALRAKNPDKSIEEKLKVGGDESIYIGLNKDEPKFMAQVNAAFAEFKKDGSLSAIAVKWLGKPLPADL